jgi:hypothetical protein
LKIYTEFINNWDRSCSCLNEASKSSSGLANFLKACDAPFPLSPCRAFIAAPVPATIIGLILSVCYQSVSADPACGKLALNAFMIMPVQRVPRYSLLLRDLLRQTPEVGLAAGLLDGVALLTASL